MKGKNELFVESSEARDSSIDTDHYKLQSWEASGDMNKKISFSGQT